MGASVSTNISESLSSVNNNLLNSTNVSVDADNNCLQNVNMDGCAVQALGDIIVRADCTQANRIAQYGAVANRSQMENDVSQLLTQEALSEVSGFGIGVAAATNHAITSSSITNNVTNATTVSMNIANSSEGTIDCTDSSFTAAGDVIFSASADQTIDGVQTGQVDNYTEIANTVSQEVSQTATATVSGIDLSMLLVVVICFVIIIVIASISKKKTKSQGFQGGDIVSSSNAAISILSIIIAVAFLIVGLVSFHMAVPCNTNGQCRSSNWWETGWGCSCTDRNSCGLNVTNQTPVPVVGAPLMFLSQMSDSSGGVLYASNLRKRLVRSIAGFSGTSSMNNSGYNIGTYLALRQTAINSPRVQAMLKFVQRKISPINSSSKTVVIYPTTTKETFKRPCTNLLLESLLPLSPYYLADAYLPPGRESCSYHRVFNTKIDSSRLLKQKRPLKNSLSKKAAKMPMTKLVKGGKPSKTALNSNPTVLGAVNMGLELCYHATTNPDGTPGPVVFQEANGRQCQAPFRRMWNGSGRRETVTETVSGRQVQTRQRLFGAQARGQAEDRCTIPTDRFNWAQYNNADLHNVNLNGVCDRAMQQGNQIDNLDMQCSPQGPHSRNRRSMGLILGVVAPGGNNGTMINATQVCQEITSNTGNVFGARFNGSQSDFSFDVRRRHNGVTALNVDGVGYRSGDAFCAHALGLQPSGIQSSVSRGSSVATSNWDAASRASKTTGAASTTQPNTITGGVGVTRGQQATFTVNDNQAPQFIAGKIDRFGGLLSAPATYNVDQPETDASTNKLLGPGFGIGSGLGPKVVHPVGYCQITRQSHVDYMCDSTNRQNCYTPWLCRHMGGYWSNDRIDKATGELIACSTMEECYRDGAQCLNDPPCSVNNCGACSTAAQSSSDGKTSECLEARCAVNPLNNSQCVTGCNPSNTVCMTCAVDKCASPCGWTGITCSYGSTLCDPDNPSSNYECPQSYATNDPRNIVRIPEAFMATTSVPNETNCLPNIFVPTPTTDTGFNNSGGAVPQDNVRACDIAQATATGRVGRFDVNCVSTRGDCYNDVATCKDAANRDSRFFRTVQIPGSAACFFGNPLTQSNPSAPDPFSYAAVPQQDFQIWASFQMSDANRGLWFMCNRVFSWVMMFANSPGSNLDLLGLSTLMNSQGMDDSGSEPVLRLRSAEDIEDHLRYNRLWSRIQPLLFQATHAQGDQQNTFFFATLEDIDSARKGDGLIGDIEWQDVYLTQINQFVYDNNGNTQWPSPDIIAQNGIGGNVPDNASTRESLAVMKQFAGTLVGSTGTCQTIFSNDYITYGSFSLSITVVLAVLIYWIIALSRARK